MTSTDKNVFSFLLMYKFVPAAYAVTRGPASAAGDSSIEKGSDKLVNLLERFGKVEFVVKPSS